MNIHFRDVQTGSVEARAVIEIAEGVFLNEVTILNLEGEIVVEFPMKSFVGRADEHTILKLLLLKTTINARWELRSECLSRVA